MSLKEELGLDKPIDTEEHECLLNIIYTGTLISKLSNKFFSNSGTTDAQFNVLMQLKYSHSQELSQVALSRRLFVNRADVTGLIDRLEKADMVKRTAHPEDRRINMISITKKGMELLEKLEPVYFKEVNRVLSSLDQGNIRQIIKSLEKIRMNLK